MAAGGNDIFGSLRIDRKPLYEQVADKMQESIAANQLRPGAQLPTERELAAQLRVNRTTVHQALGLLQQRGIVEMRVGSGTYVIDMPNSVVADSIQRYLVFGNCSAAELIEFRELFEPGLAALAAAHATEAELRQLSRLIHLGEEAFGRGAYDAYAEADAAFHETLAAASHNELVIAISAGIHALMRSWLSADGRSHLLLDSPRSHRAVYEAVAARDAVRARKAMEAHLQLANAALLKARALHGEERSGASAR
jgi:GntR family transcriptional repressor for pyruvate dehydrogenase complex